MIFVTDDYNYTCYLFDTAANTIKELHSDELCDYIVAARYWRGEIFILVDPINEYYNDSRLEIYKYNIITDTTLLIDGYDYNFVGMRMQTRNTLFSLKRNLFLTSLDS